MLGVDYARASVELCVRRAGERGVAVRGSRSASSEQEGEGKGEENSDGSNKSKSGAGEKNRKKEIEFQEWDIMRSSPPSSWLEPGFDVVLDKGTFDAVSLSCETDEGGRRVCEGYRARVERLVRKGGVLVVTSCNWTEEELVGWFEGGDGDGDGGGGLERWGRVEYPVFRFGGKMGQSVQTVVFRRRG